MAEEPRSDNLSALLPEGSILLGFAGSIKLLRPDGSVGLRHVWRDVLTWEALGMVTSLCDDLRDELRADSGEEEDE
jgi:hypothetical protein